MNALHPQTKGWLTWLVKVFITLLIIAGITWSLLKAQDGYENATRNFKSNAFSLTELHFGWLTLSGLLFLLATFPAANFWYQLLKSFDQQPNYFRTIRAYYLGSLGKYVPGKALVVILRTTLVKKEQTQIATVVTSIFIETLSFMAAGTITGLLALSFYLTTPWNMVSLSGALLLLLLVPLSPRFLTFFLKSFNLQHKFPNLTQQFSKLSSLFLLKGTSLLILGWLLSGLSLWAILKAMPGEIVTAQLFLKSYTVTLATVTLSVVIGFLSFLPGGLGVREMIIIPMMVTITNNFVAVVCAIVLRLCWLSAELIFSATIYLIDPAWLETS